MAEAWASIARKDAAVEQQQQPVHPKPKSGEKLQTVVVDTNAFIEGTSLSSGLVAYQLCTIKEVVDEIRDQRSRSQLEALPVELTIMDPLPESISKVVNFARATGDLHVLSGTDLKVIALAHTLEVGAHGDKHLRTKPPPLVRTVDRRQQHDPPGWGSNVANPEEWDELPDDDGENVESRILGLKNLHLSSADEKNEEDTASQTSSRQYKKVDAVLVEDGWERAGSRSTRLKHKKRATLHAALAEAAPKDSNRVEDASVEDMEACGESEVSDHDETSFTSQEESRLRSLQEREKDPDDETDATDGGESEQSWDISPMVVSTVACLTTDFAMQNVILQMGLRLFTPTGRQVRELQRWVLRCQACGSVSREVERLFCPKCGNGGTLSRVSMTVGANGSVAWGCPRRTSIRGTRYSLPLPKGGREGAASNPVLREDQVPLKTLYPRSKKKTSAGLDTVTSFDDGVQAKDKRAQGHNMSRSAISLQLSGRRNPNDLHYGRKRS